MGGSRPPIPRIARKITFIITPILVYPTRCVRLRCRTARPPEVERQLASLYSMQPLGRRLHVEVAAWADTYAALFANFALTPNCVCHVQPVRAEQPSEFGALARQGRVTGYPSDNHRITIFLSGLFLCFLNVGDRENASAVRAFGCGV